MNDQQPRVVAVASGKGGVGKSLLAANVGIFLATLGKRVVLVDGALGMPNLHIFAGVPRPARTLAEALVGSRLEDVTLPTPVSGMRLVAGAHDPAWVSGADAAMVERLSMEIRGLPADWVVIDLAPGTSAASLELFLDADIPMLVAVPDPTSIELMFRFVRAAFVARLRRLGLAELAHTTPVEARQHEGGIVSPLDLYRKAVAADDPRLAELRLAMLGFAPQLVINAARSKHDMEIGRAVATAGRRRLGVPLRYLGHLEHDEAVWASTRRRRPLLVEHPEARITKNIEKVTRGLMAVQRAEPSPESDVLPPDAHYDLLEVAPTASFEDIRRANRRIRDIYGAESVAISGLYDPAGLEAVHRRLDLAYTTLMDAAKRKEYDHELFPEGVPAPPGPAHGDTTLRPPRPSSQITAVDVTPAVERPPMPPLDPKTEYTGALLRQVREALGIELREIAERTKIGMSYLDALESEDYGKLPATVYVRGFLGEYARILGLETRRVVETYLERYRTARVATANPEVEEDK